MPHVTLRYEHAKLYEEVWAEAVTKVAVRYGISEEAEGKTSLKEYERQVAFWTEHFAGQPLDAITRNGVADLLEKEEVQQRGSNAEPVHRLP